ncbi:MAG: esterase-like activity of phytase family protein [Ferruginibacter sp.]|nr:esterase-like activity of phytase family protein [Chitinophagaceae bacterium]
MRSFLFIFTSLFCYTAATAQPPLIGAYTVDNVYLPADMNKQVCISGMKFYKNQLYFASERCPYIIVFDPEKRVISNTINLRVPQNFEMEGMTSYQDKLYLVSESMAAVYEVTIATGAVKTIQTSIPLPEKLKSGDGMEGIAANEKNNKFYLLRERNEDLSRSQLYTFSIEKGNDNSPILLKFENMTELPLENPQWRYSDICVDSDNARLLCLKSYSKVKFRQQYLESIDIDPAGNLLPESRKTVPVENFTDASNSYKTQDYSMNLEGITIDDNGTIYIISDNTSGKASCDLEAREKTILLHLKKK